MSKRSRTAIASKQSNRPRKRVKKTLVDVPKTDFAQNEIVQICEDVEQDIWTRGYIKQFGEGETKVFIHFISYSDVWDGWYPIRLIKKLKGEIFGEKHHREDNTKELHECVQQIFHSRGDIKDCVRVEKYAQWAKEIGVSTETIQHMLNTDFAKVGMVDYKTIITWAYDTAKKEGVSICIRGYEWLSEASKSPDFPEPPPPNPSPSMEVDEKDEEDESDCDDANECAYEDVSSDSRRNEYRRVSVFDLIQNMEFSGSGWTCGFCQQESLVPAQVMRPHEWMAHLRTYHLDMVLQCSECDKTFSEEKELAMHVHKKHQRSYDTVFVNADARREIVARSHERD